MPTITRQEHEAINRLSNKVFDVLFQECELDEKRADKIAREVIDLLIKLVEGKR